ncbi:MAG TPA: protein kinase [Micromonosporaceae bacterium]
MPGGITGYTEVRELDYQLTERTVLAVHDATGDHVVIRYLSEDVHIDQLREHVGRLSTVESRYVVRVREVVVEETRRALVLEPVEGLSLRAILDDQGVMTVEVALFVLRGSLCGLAAAHAAAVVHRAYRPESVLVGFDGEIRLFDFGLGAVAAGDDATADIRAAVVTFVEILTGVTALGPAVDELVSAVPVPLRDLVRAGVSETVDMVALLASLDTVAVAAYGAQWAERGRLWLALRAEELRVEQLRAEAALVEERWGEQAEAAGVGAAAGAGAAAGVAGLLAAEELRLRRLREQELRERLAHAATLRVAAAAAEQRWEEECRGAGRTPDVPDTSARVPAPAPPSADVAGPHRRRRFGRLVMAGTFVLLICGGFLTWFLTDRHTPTPTPEVPVASSPTGSPSTVPAVPAASESTLPSPTVTATRTAAPVPPAPTGSWSPVPKGRSEGGPAPTPTPSSVTSAPSPSGSSAATS